MREKVFRRRIYFTAFIILLFSLCIAARLVTLHFSDKIVTEPQTKPAVLRGAIKDRSGFILAMSVDSYSIYANPEEIINVTETVEQLSRLTGLSEKFLRERLDKKRRFVWIKRKVDKSVMEAVKGRKLPGISFRREFRRVYPYSNLAANIIGFAGIDNNGLEGIEYQYNTVLNGSLENAPQEDTAYGNNIVLTIDRFAQKKTEEELKKAVEAVSAKQGAAVVLEAKTGRILALAKYPGYDCNRYYAYPEYNIRNFSVIDSYEPGSTMKVFSMAAAYEYNGRLFQRQHICRGAVQIGDVIINCERPHGKVTVEDIISQSCNVGVIETMRSVPRQFFYDFLKRFGFGIKTDSGLPGETSGILHPVDRWSGLSKYSMSIGYELSVTSLQLAAAYAALGNGGIYNTPSIIERIENRDGSIIRDFTPQTKGKACEEKTASTMLKLMEGPIGRGTGFRAALDYYKAAGKTGTSKKYSANKGLYTDSPIASFAGIVPAGDSSICMLIIIDSPAGGQGGGTAAAPVFARTLNRILPYLGVKQGAVKGTDPALSKKNQNKYAEGIMPDFTGMTIGEAFDLLKELEDSAGIIPSFQGTGQIWKQHPAPGQHIGFGSRATLYLRENQ